MHIQEITLYVNNLQSMVEFYRDVLGMVVKWDLRERKAQLRHDGMNLVLQERKPLPEEWGNAGELCGLNESFMLSIHLPYFADVDREYNWIVRAGGRAVQVPQAHDAGTRSAIVADPEGNLIQLVSDNHGLPEWEALLESFALHDNAPQN